MDKQQKGHLTREDFLRIPELAINPLGDRIVHAFFRDSSNKDEEEGGKFNGANEKEIVNFPDFVRVLAHFRPIKKNAEKNKMNSRTEKLRCKLEISLSCKNFLDRFKRVHNPVGKKDSYCKGSIS